MKLHFLATLFLVLSTLMLTEGTPLTGDKEQEKDRQAPQPENNSQGGPGTATTTSGNNDEVYGRNDAAPNGV
ncbi:hypothetical protein BDA99DRAFT_510819, partial [Phascolomyces articulosus]